METTKTKTRIKKTKEEIFKKVKNLIMMEEIVRKDFEKILNSIKSPDEAADAVNNIGKVIRSKKSNILWLEYQQGQIFQKFKANEHFIGMFKELGISKSTILFKILIVKFVNKYLTMKKSSLFLHFLKNNFKIIKEICHENASEFK